MKLYYYFVRKIIQQAAARMCRECQGFIPQGVKILDLGCGSGIVGQTLRDFFGADLLGADIKDNRIVNIPFRPINGKDLPFQDNAFDVCFISYVLHHSQDLAALLREVKRVAREIIIYEDLPEGVFAKVRCLFHRISYNMVAGTPGKICNFKTQAGWERLFGDLGLEVVTQKRASSAVGALSPIRKMIFVLRTGD